MTETFYTFFKTLLAGGQRSDSKAWERWQEEREKERREVLERLMAGPRKSAESERRTGSRTGKRGEGRWVVSLETIREEDEGEVMVVEKKGDEDDQGVEGHWMFPCT